MLDRLVEEERRIEQKYNLPFRAPRTTATTIHSCNHCQQDIALLIFGDYAKDAAGLEAYARLMDAVIQRTNLSAYVIAPPSDPRDLDSPALLLNVYPTQGEPSFTTPDQWEELIRVLSDEHCKQPLTTKALSGILLKGDNANVVTGVKTPMTQAHEKQPIIQIDDLAPITTLGGYHASCQEGMLTAHAWLNPVNDQPARGYALEYTYNHKQLNRQLSDKQIDTCTTLVSKLRSELEERLQRAGWREIARPNPGQSIWQHESRMTPALRPKGEDGLAKARRKLDKVIATHKAEQDQESAIASSLQVEQERKQESVISQKKIVEVKKTSSRARAPYTREISAKVITFSCSRCHKQVRVEKYPGKIFYCEECAPIVKREKTKVRVAQYYRSHPEARKKKAKS